MTDPSAASPRPDGHEQPFGLQCSPTRPEHVVTGAGITLRCLRSGESRSYVTACTDPEARHWLGWPKGISVERITGSRAGLDDRWVRTLSDPGGDRLEFAVVGRGDEVVGFVGLTRVPAVLRRRTKLAVLVDLIPAPPAPDWQLGVVLLPPYRGQQIGRRAVRLMTEFAHRHLGMAGVTAGVEPANVASHRVLIVAGYVRVDGPAEHVLPDGRRAAAVWLRHTGLVGTGADRCRHRPEPPRPRYKPRVRPESPPLNLP